MRSSLHIEIENNDGTYVEPAVAKARRRRALICFVIQQTILFVLFSIILAFVVWLLFFKKRDGPLVGYLSLVIVFMLYINVGSNMSYDYFLKDGVHDKEYDIYCAKCLVLPTPWCIKWFIRKGKKFLER